MPRKKTLLGLVIPFLPIFLIFLVFTIRNIIICDVDVPGLFIILMSPLFFIIGGAFSIYEVKHSDKKSLPIIALIINIVFLILCFAAWSGIRIG
jgi:hypothetical protein